jgi:hypothetical protein
MLDPEALHQESDEQLAGRMRELMSAMGPLEEQLGKLRVQVQQVATEQRRRERQRHLQTRIQVRTTLAKGQLPTLQQVAESLNDLVAAESPLSGLRFFRDSGTEIGLGYATGREPTVWMTSGGSTVAVRTVAEIRSRYADGWDFGTAAHPGVRIHIPNSRTERIVNATEIFVRPRES